MHFVPNDECSSVRKTTGSRRSDLSKEEPISFTIGPFMHRMCHYTCVSVFIHAFMPAFIFNT